MKFKELFNITVTTDIYFDLFTSKYAIPETSTWQSLISLVALDDYLYNNMSDLKLNKRWDSEYIKKEFNIDNSLIDKVRQAYFNAIFKAHEYKLNGLAESMFYEYDPLVNYDRTETQTHNETVVADDRTVTNNIGARSQTETDNGRSDTTSNKTTAFDSTSDYDKGTGSSTTQYGAVTQQSTSQATSDQTTQDGYTDQSNGGYTLNAKGNIGVTTSQQMLESERSVRQFSFFEKVAEVLQSEICVADWEEDKEDYYQSSTPTPTPTPTDVYTKAEVDARLLLKADVNSVYNKTVSDNKFAVIENTHMTGTITVNGTYSLDIGSNNTVNSMGVAVGNSNTVDNVSIAVGQHNTVEGNVSCAIGNNLTTNTNAQIVLGYYNNPSISDCFQVGYGTYTEGKNAIAINRSGVVSFDNPIKMYNGTESIDYVPFRFGVVENTYGYYDNSNTFHPFDEGSGEGTLYGFYYGQIPPETNFLSFTANFPIKSFFIISGSSNFLPLTSANRYQTGGYYDTENNTWITGGYLNYDPIGETLRTVTINNNTIELRNNGARYSAVFVFSEPGVVKPLITVE